MKRKSRGFTLLELVLVIAITGCIIALITPRVVGVRENARKVHCINNMRQLSMAALLYAADHKGMVPDIAPDPSNPDACLANSDYIDDDDVYVCPRDSRAEDEFGDFKTSYTATLFTPGFVFATGLSSLILYIESDQAGVLAKDQIDDLEKHCTARHGGISNISYADGSINSYNTQSIASLAKTVQPAAVTAGGRAVGRPSAPQRDTGGRRVGPEEAVSSAGGGPVAASTSSGGGGPVAASTSSGSGPTVVDYGGGGGGQEDEPKPPKKLMSAGRHVEGDKEIVEYTYDDGSVERYEYPIDTGGTDTGGGGGPEVVDLTESGGVDDDFDPARTADGIDPEGGYGAGGGGAEEEGKETEETIGVPTGGGIGRGAGR